MKILSFFFKYFYKYQKCIWCFKYLSEQINYQENEKITNLMKVHKEKQWFSDEMRLINLTKFHYVFKICRRKIFEWLIWNKKSVNNSWELASTKIWMLYPIYRFPFLCLASLRYAESKIHKKLEKFRRKKFARNLIFNSLKSHIKFSRIFQRWKLNTSKLNYNLKINLIL